jgi:D-3-phosphoglycerate dehydrogenase
MIRLTVVGAQGEHAICGAMFGEDDYRIVRVNGCYVEAVPHGHILVLFNEDRPGIIGFIGQVLGEAQVNIAGMNLTRQSVDGQAVSLINVDSCISDETLEKLRAHPHIIAASQIVL